MVAPAGTPKAIVGRLSTEITRAVQTPDLRERFARMGSTATSSTPAEFEAFIKRDYERWARVIRNAGIKAE
jgi:tripartite-type tricarboxylate transporter receptor subunit TctC